MSGLNATHRHTDARAHTRAHTRTYTRTHRCTQTHTHAHTPFLGEGLAVPLPAGLEVRAELEPEQEEVSRGHLALSRLGSQPKVLYDRLKAAPNPTITHRKTTLGHYYFHYYLDQGLGLL